MRIQVEYLGHIRSIINNKRREDIEIPENSTIEDLLSILANKYGESFKRAVYEAGSLDLKANFVATINGSLLNELNGIKTRLKQDDQVIIMPVVSGG